MTALPEVAISHGAYRDHSKLLSPKVQTVVSLDVLCLPQPTMDNSYLCELAWSVVTKEHDQALAKKQVRHFSDREYEGFKNQFPDNGAIQHLARHEWR